MNMRYKLLIILFLFVPVSLLTHIFSDAHQAWAEENAALRLSEKVYIDPKGFFRIRPPVDWGIREYKSDPRGKVDFNSSPYKPMAQLKIIAAKSGSKDFQELLVGTRNSVDRMVSRLRSQGLKASGVAREITVDGEPAVETLLEIPGQFKQRQVLLIRAGNEYTFAFASPPVLFEKHLSLVKHSMETFEAVPVDMSEKDAILHQVASKIRTAQLYMELGQIQWARQSISEGLEIDPGNAELLKIKKELER